MTSSNEAKTEPASPERLRRARREGRVAMSRDVIGVTTMAAGLGVTLALGPAAVHSALAAGRASFQALPALMSDSSFDETRAAPPDHAELSESIPRAARMHFARLARITLAVGVGTALGALLGAWIQIGILWAPAGLKPSLDHVNPSAGLRRLFSAQKGAQLVSNLLKLFATALVATSTVRDWGTSLSALPRLEPGAGATTGLQLCGTLLGRLLLTYAGLAALDWMWQRSAFARQMRMTRSEVRREHREHEGDPQQRGRRQELAKELLLNGPIEAVSRATVVVVNPVHVAVALGLDRHPRGAPTLLVKGRGARALRIRAEARRCGIPVVAQPPLARTLSRIAVGEEIPDSTWPDVLDVLAVVAPRSPRLDAPAATAGRAEPNVDG